MPFKTFIKFLIVILISRGFISLFLNCLAGHFFHSPILFLSHAFINLFCLFKNVKHMLISDPTRSFECLPPLQIYLPGFCFSENTVVHGGLISQTRMSMSLSLCV